MLQLSPMSTNVQILYTTTSLCPHCKHAIDASVLKLANNEVWMHKVCEDHGEQLVKLSDNADWYLKTRNTEPVINKPLTAHKALEHGCPFDCGPCELHQQKTRLPIITITSACDLACPKCYVHNKNDNAFNMDAEQFLQSLDHIIAQNCEPELVNITGGEPTLHPQFLQLIELCHTRGIRRISVCTNGIKMGNDEQFTRRFAELGGRVALSFDSFNDDANFTLNGSRLSKIKHRCMELFEKYNVGTTLIPVIAKGINDHEIGDIIRYAFSKKNVRHIEFHTISFTGPGGSGFNKETRITLYEVLQRVEQQTNGLVYKDGFIPSPCAHPLCYQIAYFLIDPHDGTPIPFTRFLDKKTIYECLTDNLYLEPTPRLEQAIRQAMDNIWCSDAEDSERILRVLKHALAYIFPSDRAISSQQSLQRSEELVKAIYVHSHMDEDNFDVERIVQCCDNNCYPDGSFIPVCAYNILYRDKEAHFNTQPLQWHVRKGGVMQVNITR